jgi:type VI secretion system protein ImpE
MNASDYFKAGQLQAALDAQLQEVKANPGDPNRRLFLFELCVFAGDLERAKRQIEVLHYDDPKLENAAGLYRLCLQAEQARRAFFAGGPPPVVIGDAPEHVNLRLEAWNALRSGQGTKAAQLLQQANDGAPALKGTVNGQAFEGLRDGDDLFGGVLEVFGQGRYYWLPLEHVDSIQSNSPQFPRDLFWLPGRAVTKVGPAGDVFLPVLYPGAHEHADDAIRLGRSTDWPAAADGIVRGIGAKTFLAGDQALGLTEIRELQIT